MAGARLGLPALTNKLPPDASARRRMKSMRKRWARKLDFLAGELKRRRVIQVTGFYLVAAWGASQGVAEILPVFGAPDWAIKAFVITAFGATPAVVALSWMFDVTPAGIERDRSAPPLQGTREAGEVDATTLLGSQQTGQQGISAADGRPDSHSGRFTMVTVIVIEQDSAAGTQ